MGSGDLEGVASAGGAGLRVMGRVAWPFYRPTSAMRVSLAIHHWPLRHSGEKAVETPTSLQSVSRVCPPPCDFHQAEGLQMNDGIALYFHSVWRKARSRSTFWFRRIGEGR
jgi:hypothetical protein